MDREDSCDSSSRLRSHVAADRRSPQPAFSVSMTLGVARYSADPDRVFQQYPP